MANVESVHFETRDSLPSSDVYPTEGDYVRPGKARGVSHKLGEGTTEWVMWGGAYFVRQQGEDKYVLAGTPAPPGVFLQFDLLTTIEQYTDSASIVGEEQVDGADTTNITILYDMKALPDLAYLSPEGKGRLDIWVDKDTKYIHRLGFSAWNTDTPLAFTYYSRFNEPISPPIEQPDVNSLPPS
jgi:hypothetical protein